jgi:hypothetical protein
MLDAQHVAQYAAESGHIGFLGCSLDRGATIRLDRKSILRTTLLADTDAGVLNQPDGGGD